MAQWIFRARRGAAWQTALGLAALGTLAALTGAFLVGPMLKVKPPKSAARLAETHHSSAGAPMDEDSGDERTPATTRGSQQAQQDEDDDAPTAKPRQDQPVPKPSTHERARAKPDTDATDDDSGSAREARSRREQDDTAREGTGADSRKATRVARDNARAVDGDTEKPATPAKPEVSLREMNRHSRVENPHAVTSKKSAESDETGDEDQSPGSTSALYRIRVGRYSSREKADEVRARLTANGIPASVVQRGSAYSVQAGSYRVKENADRVADTLRQQELHPEVSYR